ncbi:MAG TPA: outer membrane beta-barrel protein [Cyclobacteriaceae bacterium]|nr:outer membrane beta-barrel protein [Cyclobacteriaceae bacterium]
MRKIALLSAMLFVMATIVNAQNFKPIKIGFAVGYTAPSDGGGGILFDLEPAYRINDAIAVGLRLESAAMARNVGDTKASVSANVSYTINGIYYFTNSNVRPYAGLGLGLYSLASVSVTTSTSGLAASNEFGLYPRLGIDLGHFNLNLDYNIIPSSEAIISTGTSPENIKIINSFLGIRIGFFVFGGKK